jgi:3-oxoacyl-[acyl-carrier protein] reductase
VTSLSIEPSRVAVVFGGAKGVGAETCRFLLGLGAGVVVAADIDEAALKALEGDLAEPAPGRLLTRPCDVTSQSAVNDVVAGLESDLGRVDILVNNAGIPPERVFASTTELKLFVDSEPDDWQPWLAVNLFGVAYTMKAVLPGMLQRGYGRIVNCISESAREGMAGGGFYAAAKAGVAGLSRTVSAEVARAGITVNCVSLGMTRTPTMLAVEFTDAQLKAITRRYHAGRLGESDDVAAVIGFLCTDQAGWVTAQTIPVNGGFSSAL